jgi:hypothetical protein
MQVQAPPGILGAMLAARDTAGFLVEDSQGRRVGLVEGPMYGNAPNRPDALAVRVRRRYGRHFIVPAGAIDTIDDDAGTISLQLERGNLQTFL